MASSHFQIVLISLLSAGLVALVSSSPASGYPAGAAVSLGSNPIRSGAGEIDIPSSVSTGDIVSSTPDQQLVITDVMVGFFQKHNHCRGAGVARLKGSDGVLYGSIPVYSATLGNAASQASQISATSGFLIPTDISIHIDWEWGWRECDSSYYTLAYNLTGYLATP
jgi:hypothetical protein